MTLREARRGSRVRRGWTGGCGMAFWRRAWRGEGHRRRVRGCGWTFCVRRRRSGGGGEVKCRGCRGVWELGRREVWCASCKWVVAVTSHDLHLRPDGKKRPLPGRISSSIGTHHCSRCVCCGPRLQRHASNSGASTPSVHSRCGCHSNAIFLCFTTTSAFPCSPLQKNRLSFAVESRRS